MTGARGPGERERLRRGRLAHPRLVQERCARLEEALAELCARSAEGVGVIVEGPRDEAALRSLGLVGKVFKISEAGAGLPMLAETVAAEADEVIMLTDFDPKGDSIAEGLGRLLERHGVAVDPGLRARLRILTRASNVEGIPHSLERISVG